jgi:tRNA pseudouridine55 synthase
MIVDKHTSLSEVDFEAGAVLAIDKPANITSFGVVRCVRRWTGCRKVGHAGTLDPMATGVLLVCTGPATKRVSEFMDLEKEYEGTIELGITTDTDDAQGKVTGRSDVPLFSRQDILSILVGFQGVIHQIPPMYSAIKMNGSRLYRLARRGKVIPREPRKVTIHEITLLDWNSPRLSVRVRCSKGTYIRALARDVGERCGTGGTLMTLRRTRLGPHRADDAYTLDTLREWLVVQHDERIPIDR